MNRPRDDVREPLSRIPQHMKQSQNKLISKCLCGPIRLSKDVMWMPKKPSYRRRDFSTGSEYIVLSLGSRRWTGLPNGGMLSNGSRSKAPSLQESFAVRAWICKRFQTRRRSLFFFQFFFFFSFARVSQQLFFHHIEKNVISLFFFSGKGQMRNMHWFRRERSSGIS